MAKESPEQQRSYIGPPLVPNQALGVGVVVPASGNGNRGWEDLPPPRTLCHDGPPWRELKGGR